MQASGSYSSAYGRNSRSSAALKHRPQQILHFIKIIIKGIETELSHIQTEFKKCLLASLV